MDAFETFKNLPDSEQQKFFETFIQKYVSETSPTKSPRKSGEVEDSRKKQRTLDSWLIKRGDDSPCKNKSKELPHQCDARSNSELDNVTKSCVNPVATLVNNADSSTSMSSLNSLSSDSQSSSALTSSCCESGKDNVSVSCSVVVEDCNLSSKRKLAELSTCKSPAKKTKNRDDNLENYGDKKLNCFVCLSTESVDSHTTGNFNVGCQSLSIPRKSSIEVFNHLQQIEANNNYHSTSNLDVSLGKKAYNLRTKKEKLRSKSSVESSMKASNVTNNDLTIKINNITSESSCQIAKTNISLQSSYEAFQKLDEECSKIGLNAMDILQHEKIQNLLHDHGKLSNDSVVLLGSFKSNNGEKLPVVHVIESKKRILEALHILENGS